MMAQLPQQVDANYMSEILEQKNVNTLLESIKQSPKSCRQLATDCDIPLSTTYRTIGEMARLNFVKIKHIFNDSGKWEKIYKFNEFCIESIKNEIVSNKITDFGSDLK